MAALFSTVGANTAQLGALNIPMVVVLAIYQWNRMRAYDGILGLLVNLPLLGTPIAIVVTKLIVHFALKSGKLYSWPNIWAGREIVPELLGQIKPTTIAELMEHYLNHPEELDQIRQNLQQLRGRSGAAQNLAQLVVQLLGTKSK